MSDLSIANVISITLASTPTGLSAFNTSNIALFTDETPDPVFDDGYKIYKEPTEVGVDFGTSSITYEMAVAAFAQAPNFLGPGGYLVIIPLEVSETLAAAITRTASLVQYFGVISNQIESQTDMLAAAAVVQSSTMNKIAFFVQRNPTSIDNGGSLDLLKDGSFSKSRGLFYGSDNDDDALLFMAAYAGRALSVNFSGSNTTQSMQLKSLATIQPDPSMNQTLYQKAQDAGADVYAGVEGIPAVMTSGENKFFDQVYNAGWFVGALQVAGFNYLRQTSGKIPQTDNGVLGLVGAYQKVCIQGVTNGYGGPGVWNSPISFGDQANLLSNVAEFGFYVYAAPIALQPQVDREDRKAPLIQIAFKETGAIHSSAVVVYVNA